MTRGEGEEILNGLARLYTFLGSAGSFPLPVRAAAVVTGMAERDVVAAVNGTTMLTGLFAKTGDGLIYQREAYFMESLQQRLFDCIDAVYERAEIGGGDWYRLRDRVERAGSLNDLKEVLRMEKRGVLDGISIGALEAMHREMGLVALCEDGHGVELFKEEDKKWSTASGSLKTGR